MPIKAKRAARVKAADKPTPLPEIDALIMGSPSSDPLEIPAVLKRTPLVGPLDNVMRRAVERTTPVQPALAPAPEPIAASEPTKPKRRRRRRRSALLADRTIAAIKAKERDFLREVGAMLTSAIGFPVHVSRVRVAEPLSLDMRRARRMTKAKAKVQIKDAFAPLERTLGKVLS